MWGRKREWNSGFLRFCMEPVWVWPIIQILLISPLLSLLTKYIGDGYYGTFKCFSWNKPLSLGKESGSTEEERFKIKLDQVLGVVTPQLDVNEEFMNLFNLDLCCDSYSHLNFKKQTIEFQ